MKLRFGEGVRSVKVRSSLSRDAEYCRAVSKSPIEVSLTYSSRKTLGLNKRRPIQMDLVEVSCDAKSPADPCFVATSFLVACIISMN